jgi:nitrite reductase/ring-hydroxylating ferredoxin subunit
MAANERLICAAVDLVDGGRGVRFEIERHGVREAAFAVRYGGKVRAYLNRCAHVPVELDWQPGEFFDDSGLYLICATHGAIYAPESGRCLGGRCNGKGLQPIAVAERGEQIFLVENA